MNKLSKLQYLGFLFLLSLSMTACQQTSADNQPAAEMANPASVYCVELGYQLDIRQTDAGEEGICIFTDGVECPEWDFLAGRCGGEYSYCQMNAGVLSDNGTNIGTCIFEDGSTCDELAFSQGDCLPGQNPAGGE